MRKDIFCGVVASLASVVVGVDAVRYEMQGRLPDAWIGTCLFVVLAVLAGWSFSKLAKN